MAKQPRSMHVCEAGICFGLRSALRSLALLSDRLYAVMSRGLVDVVVTTAGILAYNLASRLCVWGIVRQLGRGLHRLSISGVAESRVRRVGVSD